MPSESPKSYSDDPHLNQVIAAYFEAFETGNAPDREQLLADLGLDDQGIAKAFRQSAGDLELVKGSTRRQAS